MRLVPDRKDATVERGAFSWRGSCAEPLNQRERERERQREQRLRVRWARKMRQGLFSKLALLLLLRLLSLQLGHRVQGKEGRKGTPNIIRKYEEDPSQLIS